MWVSAELLSLATRGSVTETLLQENYVLRVRAEDLQSALSQCQKEKAAYCTYVTELHAELEEVWDLARRPMVVPHQSQSLLEGLRADGPIGRLQALVNKLGKLYSRSMQSPTNTYRSGNSDGRPCRTGSCCQCYLKEENWKGPRCAP